jgi:hypothetical protein
VEEVLLTIIHPSNVLDNWGAVAPWILQAVGDGVDASDVIYIQQQAMSGSAQIWVAEKAHKIEAVLVTEVAFYGGQKTLVLRWLAGHASEDWIDYLDYLENWAATNGYHRVEAWGRKGFEKVLRPYGYRHEFTVIGKPLARRLN